jgi:soluble lytic murein transglycosylase-like protein
MILRPFAAAAVAVAALAFPGGARAELVTLTSGRTLSVTSIDMQGEHAVLRLRGGGEMTCAASLIRSVAPDEVEYPAIAPDEEMSPSTLAVPAPADPSARGSAGWASVTAGSESRPYLTQPGAQQYETVIATAAKRHNVDPRLVHAVITVESRYQPDARSPKGAMGMMQLMPGTARDLRVGNPYDAAANIDGGVRYLRQLLDRFDLRLALAAYNAGAATVERFGGIPPYPETRNYVARVLQLVGAS